MGSIAADAIFPERRASRRQFDRAAATFAQASFFHDEARARLLERLPYFRLDVATALDLGCALGAGVVELEQRFPEARVIALDSSRAMLAVAAHGRSARSAVCGDAEALPLADRSVDLILANMVMPWCAPQLFLSEAARVLAPRGLLLFSTLGPDTLREVRQAWSRADDRIHVHGFFDMHDIGDLVTRSGLEEPVMDVDRIEITYEDLPRLADDFRACAAVNVAAGRSRGLTGRGRWRRFERALTGERRGAAVRVTAELILGHAFGAIRRGRGDAGVAEIGVPVKSIGRRR